MSKSTFQTLTFDSQNSVKSFTVTNGTPVTVDLLLTEADDPHFYITVSYPKTAGTTGTTIQAYYGTGGDDLTAVGNYAIPVIVGGTTVPTVVFDSTGNSISMATIPTSQSSPQSKTTLWVPSDTHKRMSRYCRLVFTNTDATNVATISIAADVSIGARRY